MVGHPEGEELDQPVAKGGFKTYSDIQWRAVFLEIVFVAFWYKKIELFAMVPYLQALPVDSFLDVHEASTMWM